jgi:hypothetical protein
MAKPAGTSLMAGPRRNRLLVRFRSRLRLPLASPDALWINAKNKSQNRRKFSFLQKHGLLHHDNHQIHHNSTIKKPRSTTTFFSKTPAETTKHQPN